MAETKPIPVRLEDELIKRIDLAAAKMGTNRAAMIRFLVKTFIDDFEQRGLKSLPHDWQEIMRFQDGRALRYKSQSQSQIQGRRKKPSLPPHSQNTRLNEEPGP